MTESLLKSKLKRKKFFVEEQQAKISSWGTVNRSNTTLFPSREAAEPGRSVSPAAEWWSREQLTAVETLWALTLKSALPHLENLRGHLVPELPYPSASSPPAPKLDDQRWCDLSEEVAPFPEPSPHKFLRTSSSPDPVRTSSPQSALSAQTAPEAAPPDTQLSSDPRQCHNDQTTAPQRLPKSPQPFLHSLGRGPTSASSTATNSPVSVQKTCQNEEEEVKEQEEVKAAVREDGKAAAAAAAAGGTGAGGGGGGGGELQSCPMCLLEFPAGFTQMECDGHLAQCLSEVNVDVTW